VLKLCYKFWSCVWCLVSAGSVSVLLVWGGFYWFQGLSLWLSGGHSGFWVCVGGWLGCGGVWVLDVAGSLNHLGFVFVFCFLVLLLLAGCVLSTSYFTFGVWWQVYSSGVYMLVSWLLVYVFWCGLYLCLQEFCLSLAGLKRWLCKGVGSVMVVLSCLVVGWLWGDWYYVVSFDHCLWCCVRTVLFLVWVYCMGVLCVVWC